MIKDISGQFCNTRFLDMYLYVDMCMIFLKNLFLSSITFQRIWMQSWYTDNKTNMSLKVEWDNRRWVDFTCPRPTGYQSINSHCRFYVTFSICYFLPRLTRLIQNDQTRTVLLNVSSINQPKRLFARMVSSKSESAGSLASCYLAIGFKVFHFLFSIISIKEKSSF